MLKSVIFISIVFVTILKSSAQNQTGDFDFVVTVLDNFKNPIHNLEVTLKNENDEIMYKKKTITDGTIEFRRLFKNKSYHLEFEKTHEKLKNADKIYIKDIVKTEEITKSETGFDYFVFVGENVSFSDIGIQEPRPDKPKETVQNTSSTIVSNETKITENTNSTSSVTNNEKVNEIVTETKKEEDPTNAITSNSSESTNKNSTESVNDNSKITNNERVNEVIAETKNQEVPTNKVASNSSESTNKKIAESVSENSKNTNNERVNEVVTETKKQEVPINATASNSSESTNKNSTELVSENSKNTNNERVNEVIAETKNQEVPTIAVAYNSSESNNKKTSESVNDNSKNINNERVKEVIAETKNQEVPKNSGASNSSQSAGNNSSDDVTKNEKSSESIEEKSSSGNKKTEESTGLTTKNESIKSESSKAIEVIDFSLLKDKDFNNPETHELLIKEESKIKNKKINYKVQIGAYTHQEVADKIRVNGFKVEKQTYPDGFTRLTIGNCNSLKDAEQLRKKLIAKGMKDSWIIGFYESKRYTMKDLATNNFFQ